jgi:RNA polymerase sigma factor (sigma-70 family)
MTIALARDPENDTSRQLGALQRDTLEAVLESVRLRKTGALETLRQATVTLLSSVAHRALRNRADVEDVVSEVYIRVWLHAAQFDPARGSARTWLISLCRHSSIDHLRRMGRERSKTSFAMEPEPELRSDSSPDFLLERSQSRLAVSNALSSLPNLQQNIVALSFYRDLSHGEIAVIADLPVGTVKSHLRRSLQRLQRELTDEFASNDSAKRNSTARKALPFDFPLAAEVRKNGNSRAVSRCPGPEPARM